MPACTSESITNLWNTGAPRETVRASLDTNSGSQPSSPNSSSPPVTSPIATLRRTRSAATATTLFTRQDSFVIKSDWRSSHGNIKHEEQRSLLVRLIGWYPCFLLQVLSAVLTFMLPVACVQTIIALPTLWFSAWFWMICKVFHLPLTVVKWFLTILYSPSAEYLRKKRTVLISGGSTIQALHLARNFYSAGARVVVCEVEGLFALARFSTAVNKFYTLPKPSMENLQAYVQALCNIVEKENAVYYIPVNTASSAFYDATAKAMLELHGCTCFCPGVKEVLALDDNLEMLQRCVDMGIPTPAYYSITTKSNLAQLYENGTFRTGKFVMSSCGPHGARDRIKIPLPPTMSELRIPGEISPSRPWVIIQDVPGEHFITCTTVKHSQVVANVTCRLDENKCLMPVEQKQIEIWLKNFFAKLNLLRPITGHVTFRFIVPQGSSSTVLPLGCRVGVSLPYICLTSVHPRILWKPCKHFSRQNSGPLVAEKGRYWMHQALINTVQRPSVESLTRLIGTVLDKREALFVYWDPLPYCAYYHMQLPFRNILRFLQRRRFHGTMAAPVH